MHQMYSKFSGTDKIRVSAFTLLGLGICRYPSDGDGYYNIYVFLTEFRFAITQYIGIVAFTIKYDNDSNKTNFDLDSVIIKI